MTTTDQPDQPPATDSPRVVRGGSFCSPAGATAVTTAGNGVVCRLDSTGRRNRWRLPNPDQTPDTAPSAPPAPAPLPAMQPPLQPPTTPHTASAVADPLTPGARALRHTYDQLVAARPRNAMHLDPWIDLADLADAMPARFRGTERRSDREALDQLAAGPNVLIDHDNNRIMFRDAADHAAALARRAAARPEPRTVPDYIRDAYQRIIDDRFDRCDKSRPNPPSAVVALADLRRALPSYLRRADVDAALDRMFTDPDVFLEAEANQKTLLQRDRDAAITFGNQPRHLVVLRDVENTYDNEYYARQRTATREESR